MATALGLLVMVLVVAAWPGAAAADRVTANQAAKLHEKPGESSKVVGEVAADDELTVLGRSGRWLKVRAPGKDRIVGWITRSSVDGDVVPRNTRRRPSVDRGRDSGWTQKSDRVGADVVPDAPPRMRRDAADDSGGDGGDGAESERDEAAPWSREACEDAAESIEDYDACSEPPPSRLRRLLPRKGALAFDANAGLGFASLSSAFSSNGTGTLAAYSLGSSAIAVGAGAAGRYATSDKLAVGARLDYALARAAPGVAFSDGTTTVNIPFSMHTITAAATAETVAGKFVLGAQLGFRFEKFSISNVEDLQANLAKLPTEIFSGAVLAATARLPHLTEVIGAELGAGLLLAGSRRQTAGLEDGLFASAGGFDLHVGGTYQLARMQLFGRYGLSRRTSNWSGAAPDSTRGHGATAATRTDSWNTITAGVAAQF
ncbi:MAG: SH3 domain-containing protein [Myxococcales bacterium]|nr:SH3 domain-containing protein [Myxococcales bacterium]